jgi:hypothetical protein
MHASKDFDTLLMIFKNLRPQPIATTVKICTTNQRKIALNYYNCFQHFQPIKNACPMALDIF